MNNDTITLIATVEAMDDDQLAEVLDFNVAFHPDSGSDYAPSETWRIIVQHESRKRGVFVPEPAYRTIEEWMEDSDCEYDDEQDEWFDTSERAFCNRGFRVGSVVVKGDPDPVDPFARYAGAHQSMTWEDALDSAIVGL